MHAILRPGHSEPSTACAEEAPSPEHLTLGFLAASRDAALRRLKGPSTTPGCSTFHCTARRRSVGEAPTGSIVVHVSSRLLGAWTKHASGPAALRRTRVVDQLRLLMRDLCEHEAHIQLALTEAQLDMYEHDVRQLMVESLARTALVPVPAIADVHWEGTLVRDLAPPFFVLVVSVGF